MMMERNGAAISAVRRKFRPAYFILPPVKLYFEDVEALVEILRRCFSRLSLETEDHEFDDPAAMGALGVERLTQLTIKGWSPGAISGVRIAIRKENVVVDAVGADPASRGIANESREYLLLRQRRLRRMMPPRYAFVPLILTVFLLDFLTTQVPSSMPWRWLRLALLLVALAFSAWIALSAFGLRRSAVLIARREDRKSRWTRNRDSLVVATFSVVAGGIIVYLLTPLLPRP